MAKIINGEIWGHSAFFIANDKVYARCHGEAVGSPVRKREAKREAGRLRRRYSKAVLRTSAMGL